MAFQLTCLIYLAGATFIGFVFAAYYARLKLLLDVLGETGDMSNDQFALLILATVALWPLAVLLVAISSFRQD